MQYLSDRRLFIRYWEQNLATGIPERQQLAKVPEAPRGRIGSYAVKH
jgi:hypothetical protein